MSSPCFRLRPLGLAAIIAWVALAEAAADPTYTLGPISVTAPRQAAEAPSSTLATTTVDSREIRSAGAETAADAIADIPGVTVGEQGPSGSLQTVSIRGSTSSEVLVLLDGVPLNNALSASVDLSSIPAADIQSIVVTRGGASALYGPDAVGGVVSITTKKATRDRFVATIENGSYLPARHVSGFGVGQAETGPSYQSLVDSQRLALSGEARLGQVGLRLQAGAGRAANDYLYIDPNDALRQLQNGALMQGSGELSLDAPIGRGSLTGRISAEYQKHGDPGSETLPTPQATEVDSSLGSSLAYSTSRFFSDTLDLKLLAHAGQNSVDYNDPGSGQVSNQTVTSMGASLSQNARLSDTVTLRYGGSVTADEAGGNDIGTHERISAGGWGGPTLTFGRLTIEPTVRYDFASDLASPEVSALLGFAYRLSSEARLTADLSRSVRLPTFVDLYWPAADGAAGNPDLLPEVGWGSQVGLRLERPGLRYDASLFARYMQNVIVWQQGSTGIWSPSNYGVAFYPGVEQDLSLDLAPHYTAALNYTLLYSFALSGLTFADNKRVPMVPVHTLNARIAYARDPFSWSVTAKYESLRFQQPANAAFLPSFFVVDLMARWKMGKGWSAYLAVDNLFSEQYQIQVGYPMPPARIRTGIELTF